MSTTSLPAQPAVLQPNRINYFSGGDICRGCKVHKSLCKCALSKWHDIGEELNLKQERFLRNYTQNDQLFGNGTLSYAEAYGYDLEHASRIRLLDERGNEIIGSSDYDKMHKQCGSCAARMLGNVRIQVHLNRLFNELLTDQRVDRELAKLIVSGGESVKVAAIREYNALKQRITKKVDLTTKGAAITLNAEQQAKLDALFV